MLENIAKKLDRCPICWRTLVAEYIEGPYAVERFGPWCCNPHHGLGLIGRILELIFGYRRVRDWSLERILRKENAKKIRNLKHHKNMLKRSYELTEGR